MKNILNPGRTAARQPSASAWRAAIAGLLLACTAAQAALPLDQVAPNLGVRIAGLAAPSHLGVTLADAGDFNGDGFRDIAIAAPGTAQGAIAGTGAVYVVYGTSVGIPNVDLSTLTAAQGCVIAYTGAAANSAIGAGLAGLGDFDGDGIDDLAIGSAIGDFGASVRGQAWIVHGRPAPPASIDLGTDALTVTLTGEEDGDGFGTVLAGGGSIDGDARGDLVLGAPYAAGFGGVAYVLYGGPIVTGALSMATLDGSNGARFADSGSFDFSGISAALGGDIDGDGIGDLVIGSFGFQDAAQHDTGGAWVIYGKAGGFVGTGYDLQTLPTAARTRIVGAYYAASGADSAGSSVAILRDQNGDGRDEVVVADPDASPAGRGFAGEVAVIYGAAVRPATVNLSALSGTDGFRYQGAIGGDKLGTTLAAVDLNGDGIADLAMGAPQHVNNTTLGPGKIVVAYGRRSHAANVDLADLQAERGNGDIYTAPAGVTELGSLAGLCGTVCAGGARLGIGAYTEATGAGAVYVLARPDRIFFDGIDSN